MRIVKYPDSVLKKEASKVGKVSEKERKLLADMASIMYLNQGVGLAAVQVGIGRQLAVIDIGKGLIKMINPTITRKEGSETQEEGCLSVPGVTVKVKRAKKVTVTYLDESGEVKELRADGLLARAIQHEIDHLCGRLIINYLNPLKKLLVKNRLNKLDK